MTTTEELRRRLDNLIYNLERLDIWFDNLASGMTLGEYDDKRNEIIESCVKTIAETVSPKITEDTSDGWHSFKDLYHHRALLFSVIVHNYKDMCWKSKKHDDGKELDWNFIVGIDTPWGQASYHYGMEYWDMFDCKVLDKAPHYDGYTPEQSVERIARLVELDVSLSYAETCHRIFINDWLWKCSKCHSRYNSGHLYNFCPNCGRRIEVNNDY